MNEIRLSGDIAIQFCRQAEAEYPYESCGFLLGTFDDRGADVSEYLPGKNTKSSNRERRFLIDPMDYQHAEDEAESRELSIVGIVHSHPDHPDIPSEFDRDHAFPGFSYVIISVRKGKSKSYRSWQLSHDRQGFQQETIKIKENL
ncbi:MAG: M67 family metallopeptidase [Candidatus Marinimicrobia bacterium]|nr:M67 family metallopeptidase [Candidatus Neomarinimicrobiota bacterium]